MFDEDEFLASATAKILMIKSPADQIPLPPPPPAQEIEAPAMWHPIDRLDEQERIALPDRGDPDCANAVGVWLGVSALHAVVLDSLPERRRTVPLNRKDEEEEEDKK
jgi:hypothetical protein